MRARFRNIYVALALFVVIILAPTLKGLSDYSFAKECGNPTVNSHGCIAYVPATITEIEDAEQSSSCIGAYPCSSSTNYGYRIAIAQTSTNVAVNVTARPGDAEVGDTIKAIVWDGNIIGLSYQNEQGYIGTWHPHLLMSLTFCTYLILVICAAVMMFFRVTPFLDITTEDTGKYTASIILLFVTPIAITIITVIISVAMHMFL